MSSVSKRKNVTSVESVGIPAGAILAGVCLVGLAKGLSALANAAIKASNQRKPNIKATTIESVASLRNNNKSAAEDALMLGLQDPDPSIEELKSKIFRSVTARPWLISDRREFASAVRKLDASQTVAETETARVNLKTILEAGHRHLFSNAVLDAGHRAAVRIGFRNIETLASSLESTQRFSATDVQGRTFVTEIHVPFGGEARIEAEVIGVSDGSCTAILDAFDDALEKEGVRSATPEREFTGGVCELSAARDFVNRTVVPAVKHARTCLPNADEQTVRTRRLNQEQNIAIKCR